MERAENERFLIQQRAVANARAVDRYEGFGERLEQQKAAIRSNMQVCGAARARTGCPPQDFANW